MSKLAKVDEPDTVDCQFYVDKSEAKWMYIKHTWIQKQYLLHGGGFVSNTVLSKIRDISRITRFEVYGPSTTSYVRR